MLLQRSALVRNTGMLRSSLVMPLAVRPAMGSTVRCVGLAAHRGLFSRAAKKVVEKEPLLRADGTKIEEGSREHRILRMFPRFMTRYAQRVAGAPVSHITAFIVLHEITAIAPLFGFWYLFHKYHWMIPAGIPDWLIMNGSKFIRALVSDFPVNRNGRHGILGPSGAQEPRSRLQ